MATWNDYDSLTYKNVYDLLSRVKTPSAQVSPSPSGTVLKSPTGTTLAPANTGIPRVGSQTPDAACNNLCQKNGYASGRSNIPTECVANEHFVDGPSGATYDCCCKEKGTGPCLYGYSLEAGDQCKEGYEIKKDSEGKEWCCPIGAVYPCSATGGYLGHQANGILLQKCEEGYEPKKATDGKIWCCPIPENVSCKDNSNCPEGYHCNTKTGKCELNPNVTKCTKPEDCATFCDGQPGICSEGFCRCTGEVPGECDDQHPCPAGYACVEEPVTAGNLNVAPKKHCVKTGVCAEGKGAEYTGCACGKSYATKTGVCEPGYVFIARAGTGWEGYIPGAKGRCECSKWCQDTGWGSDCQGGGGGGEFKWSPELEALMKQLIERAGYLLKYPTGLTPEEQQAIYNRAYERIIRGQRGEKEAMRSTMARMGLLGSGFELGEEEKIAREAKENLASVARDLAIKQAEDKFNQLMQTTSMAQGLFGTGMSFEQIAEALSSARRGEGRSDLQTLLAFLSLIMGNQGNNNALLQYILNLIGQQRSI